MNKTHIIDGNSLLFRAYYSTAYTGNFMRTSDGIPTNAIFAFHNMIKTIKEKVESGDHLFVAFDTGKKTKRKEEFEDYKAQRKKVDDELIAQMPIAREMLDKMSIFHDEIEGYEGDDLCGSMTRVALENNDEVCLYTSDKDFLQLCALSDKVTICFLKKGMSETEKYTKGNMLEKFGLNADQITDYKGIAGDSSDNYKGIKGIGEKTAKKLLTEHGHLEDVIKYFKANPDGKLASKIIEGETEALFFKKLAMIDTTMDMKKDYEKSLYTPYQKEMLRSFYLKYQLNNFLKAIDKLKDIKSNDDPISLFTSEDSETEKIDIINIKSFHEIQNKDDLSLVYSSNSENENIAFLYGFYFSDGKKVYLLKKDDAIKDDSFISYLKSDVKKCVYDYKSLDVLLINNSFPKINNVTFDFLLATYLLNPDNGQKREDIFLYYDIDINATADKDAYTSYYVSKLKDKVLNNLKKDELYNLFKNIEIPLSEVLADMEIEGFPIDLKVLSEIDKEYSDYLNTLEKEIKEIAGIDFNISSPKQVEDVLFNKLQIKRNKGEKGTSIEVLKAHFNDNPVVGKIILYRLYSKLVTGYTKALPKHVFKDGKIHAIYNQALTTTGRLSMSEPNLQNISIRNEDGKAIRKAFYYKEDNINILSLDYSQIELRMLATIANIEILKELFKEGDDIHKATASKVFNVKMDEVTPDMRRKAKAVNFGIVYGISPYGLSEQLSISVSEAKELIEQFKSTFVGLEEFQNKTIEFAKEHSYVKTILGRRRYLNDINSSNRMLAAFSSRAATNAVIQGSAADLIKSGMIKCQEILKGYKSKIILQIHDELLFKIYDDEKDVLVSKLIYQMEHALDIDVPLKVDGDLKKTWYEVH